MDSIEGILLSTKLLEKHYESQNEAAEEASKSAKRGKGGKTGKQITRDNRHHLKNVPLGKKKK